MGVFDFLGVWDENRRKILNPILNYQNRSVCKIILKIIYINIILLLIIFYNNSMLFHELLDSPSGATPKTTIHNRNAWHNGISMSVQGSVTWVFETDWPSFQKMTLELAELWYGAYMEVIRKKELSKDMRDRYHYMANYIHILAMIEKIGLPQYQQSGMRDPVGRMIGYFA